MDVACCRWEFWMKVEQITAVLVNAPGTFADIAALLAGNGINILACSLADDTASGTGYLRMIVNDTENAVAILADNHVEVECSEVVVAETPDKPGGLAQILLSIKKTGLNISHFYAFSYRRGDRAIVVISFDDIGLGTELLAKAGVRILSNEELLAM